MLTFELPVLSSRIGSVPIDVCGAGQCRLRIFDNLPATIGDHLDLYGVGPDEVVGLIEARTSETAIRILGSRSGHLISGQRSVQVRNDDRKVFFENNSCERAR